MSKKLEIITRTVISYCDIPEVIAFYEDRFQEVGTDVYLEFDVTSKKEQEKYDDDFTFINWIIDSYPELEGQKILIHIDY